MINRDEIEAGDKVYTRDGGCLVAYERNCGVHMAGHLTSSWRKTGYWLSEYENHPLDIIRIEKAPKPVVYEAFVGMDHDGCCFASSTFNAVRGCAKVVKVTLVNGQWDKEKSEQVK